MGIKFYRTFGHARRPRDSEAPDTPAPAASAAQPASESVAARPGLPRWLPLALVPIVALSIVSVAVLFLNVYRGDY